MEFGPFLKFIFGLDEVADGADPVQVGPECGSGLVFVDTKTAPQDSESSLGRVLPFGGNRFDV